MLYFMFFVVDDLLTAVYEVNTVQRYATQEWLLRLREYSSILFKPQLNLSVGRNHGDTATWRKSLRSWQILGVYKVPKHSFL